MAKKKDEHHGGAWKVAYADFVTAMMALFIVLWIIAPEPNDNKIVYEDEIDAAPPQPDQGAQGGDNKDPGEKNLDKEGEGGAVQRKKDLQFIADELVKLMNVNTEDVDRPVDVQLVDETVKLTLYDRDWQPIFVRNGVQVTEWGQFVLKNLAMVAIRHDMRLLLDAHTAKGQHLLMADPSQYGPWELSADRAAAARRRLIGYELPADNIMRITGYAHTRPLEEWDGGMPRQQRLTVHMSLK